MSAPMSLPAPAASDREIVSSRLFPFPRKPVFAAFSDPVQLARWWGPQGFTNTIRELDLRAGGTWRLTMHGPDGTDYPNESRFTEVVRPERIVYQHLGPMHRFQMKMLFANKGGYTRLTWHMLFESADEIARIREFVVAANEQNLDRLSAHLASTTH
jgi:uncharacterized protein YndB with AHSA1/START domain